MEKAERVIFGIRREEAGSTIKDKGWLYADNPGNTENNKLIGMAAEGAKFQYTFLRGLA